MVEQRYVRFDTALNSTLEDEVAPLPANLRDASGLDDGALSNLVTSTATASRAIVSDANGKLAASSTTSTEVGYLSGVTSAIQTQIDGKQPSDADLTAIAALTSAANKVPYATGAGTWALADFTVFGRSLVDDADATAARTTIGLGNVDNTSDANKPISTATQTALDDKADAIYTPIVQGATTRERLLLDKVRDVPSVLDFDGIDPTGVTECTNALANASTWGATNGYALQLSKGTYLTDNFEWDNAPLIGQGINESVLKAKSGMTGAVIETKPDTGSLKEFTYWSDFKIDMSGASGATGILFNANSGLLSHVCERILAYQGKIGINNQWGGGGTWRDIWCREQDGTGSRGAIWNGDNGSEQHIVGLRIAPKTGNHLEKGFEYTRTTKTDVGGLYILNSLATTQGGTMDYGWHFWYDGDDTDITDRAYAFIRLTNAFSDGVTGTGAGFSFENLSQVTGNFLWSSGAATLGALHLNNCQDVRFIEGSLDDGASGQCVFFQNESYRVSIHKLLHNQGTFLHYDTGAVVHGIDFAPISAGALTLTNSASSLLSSMDEVRYTSPPAFAVGDGAAGQCLRLIEPGDGQTSFLTRFSSGFEIRDKDFAANFRIWDSGIHQILSSQVQIDNLPTSNPGAGTKRLWVDTTDSNRVKFAV